MNAPTGSTKRALLAWDADTPKRVGGPEAHALRDGRIAPRRDGHNPTRNMTNHIAKDAASRDVFIWRREGRSNPPIRPEWIAILDDKLAVPRCTLDSRIASRRDGHDAASFIRYSAIFVLCLPRPAEGRKISSTSTPNAGCCRRRDPNTLRHLVAFYAARPQ